MGFDNKNNQDKLSYTYKSAQARMLANPEHTSKQKEIIDKCRFIKPDTALEKAFLMVKNNNNACRVWAKIDIDEDFYYLSDQWITTDDWDVSLAAEYIGLYLVYNDTDIRILLSNKEKNGH